MADCQQKILQEIGVTQQMVGKVQTTIDDDIKEATEFILKEIPVVKGDINKIITTAEADAAQFKAALIQIGNGVKEVGDGVKTSFWVTVILLVIIIVILLVILAMLRKHDDKLSKIKLL